MILREELERLLAGPMSPQHEVACANFVRYHGQAMLEALKDAERYRELKRSVNLVDHNDWQWDSEDDYEGTEQESLDSRLDLARSKTVDGGGL